MIAKNFAFIVERLDGCWWVIFNRVMLLGLTAQLCSMVVKGLFKSVKNGRFSWKEMSSYGGMPSSHTAFVVSVVLGLGMEYGWTSGMFGFGVVMVLIVLVDAVKLRGTIDKINDNVNRLIENAPDLKGTLPIPKHIAHTTAEVVGGVIFAVIYTFLFYLFFYQLLK